MKIFYASMQSPQWPHLVISILLILPFCAKSAPEVVAKCALGKYCKSLDYQFCSVDPVTSQQVCKTKTHFECVESHNNLQGCKLGGSISGGINPTTGEPNSGSIGTVCDPCNSNPQLVASVSLANNETCPVTRTHYNTYETPGCWCNITFVGRRCCYCLNNCYTTDTWTTTEQVPAPPYGSCP
jgi:hypothetical protein